MSQSELPDGLSLATHFVATNRGLYMTASDADDNEYVLKLHGDPTFDDWSKARMAGGVHHYAPTNVYTEREDEVSFYWVNLESWGSYTANTGGPGVTLSNDVRATKVASGANSGVVASRPWIIAGGPKEQNPASNVSDDYQYAWQEDGQYTSANTLSNHFGQKADDVAFDADSVDALISHPSDPQLFVVRGSMLYVYSPTALQSKTALPGAEPNTFVNQLLWYQGELWIGYGNKVLRRSASGSISVFTQVGGAGSSIISASLPGRFCVQGGEVLTADGMATSIRDGARHSWLSHGSLNSSQQLQLTLMQATLIEIYCSGETTSRAVYAPYNRTIRMISRL